MSVFVTGAQGFVGGWLAEKLLETDHHVVTLLRDVEPDSRFHTDGIGERCTQVRADLLDHDSLVRALNEYDVKTVFHLAAQTIVGTANRSPLSTFETNIRGTYLLLEACRQVGTVERIVVASSDKAYGNHDELPYREDFPLQPRYPYDVSKTATDMITRSYSYTYGLPTAVTRLANIYGGGDMNWSRIVPDTCRALINDERPVLRSDGTPERDYMYVEDAVSAYMAIADSLSSEDMHGRAWNAGHGKPHPVREVVDKLIAASGKDIEPDIQGEGTPHGEIDRQYLDSTAIKEELGWEPEWDLERGLAASWEWYSQRLAA